VKGFVSLQFPNPKTVGRTIWTGDQPEEILATIQFKTFTLLVFRPKTQTLKYAKL
jgi:hypothetical protein